MWLALTSGRAADVRMALRLDETEVAPSVQQLSQRIGEIERRAGEDPSPRALRDLGILRLAQGRDSDAALTLEAAAARPPHDARATSDLGAAYLARSRSEGRAFDLILALDAADRALALDPRLAAARYNRARALTLLSLHGQARAAWQGLLGAGDGQDAAIARRALRELSAPTVTESWAIARPRLEAAVSRQDVRAVAELVGRFPQPARVEAEERVLPAWGEARRSGDAATAATRLTWVSLVGAALARTTGDAMILDAATAIAGARGSRLDALAEGHLAYGRGVDLFNHSQIADARKVLGGAERALRTGGSPFSGWASFWGAVCDHYSDPDRAFVAFSQLRARTDPRRYPVLCGRAAWLLGTVANNRGRPEEALRRYREAFELLDASVGPQLSSFVHLLLGETYSALGEVERSWEERVTAFVGITRTGEPRRVHAALNEAATVLLNSGLAWPAVELSAEVQRNAVAWGKPSALAEAGLARGWALDLLGRHAPALLQFQEAERHAANLDRAIRDRITGPLALAQATAWIAGDPARAVDNLTSALSTDLDNGYLFQLTRLLTMRARAHRALGDDAAAERDLIAAIGYHETVRTGVRSEPLRLSAFERAQEAFDEMIRLQVDGHHDPARAFDFAERARSRLLLDLVAASSSSPRSSPRSLSAGELEAGLPAHVDLVELAVLPDRLLAWIARTGSLDLVEVPIPAADLEALVTSLRSALERRAAGSEVRAAAAALRAALIGPLENRLRPGATLVIVPDRFLVQVPFGALLDPRTGRYLIEERTVWVAPSATVFVAALAHDRSVAGGLRTALAIGDPAFDRDRYPRLPRLAAADAEARAVASLYPGSKLLGGVLATRRAFLDEAPHHRLIHFAGHALLHQAPQLSRLVLAPDPGGVTNDSSGALYADEVAHLRLDRTELVVLSACRTVTASGQRESVTGLAAAFLAAGSPAVVASLWDVEDRSTGELMRRFHAAFETGVDAATALRTAQNGLLRSSDPVLASPASWGGFEAIGGAVSNSD